MPDRPKSDLDQQIEKVLSELEERSYNDQATNNSSNNETKELLFEKLRTLLDQQNLRRKAAEEAARNK